MSDRLDATELRPVGGSWGGLLFENAARELPLSLTWSFAIDFAPVRRDYGSVEPNLAIEWVPLPDASIAAMAGRSASSPFGEPIEASVYFFQHHRFERSAVTVVDHQADRITVRADASGDVDGLGFAELAVEARLDFAGIWVQPESKPASATRAVALLSEFVDPAGLIATERPHGYHLHRPDTATAPV